MGACPGQAGIGGKYGKFSLFYENWESRELWQAHMGNQHLADYMPATEGAVAEFTVNEMTMIAETAGAINEDRLLLPSSYRRHLGGSKAVCVEILAILRALND